MNSEGHDPFSYIIQYAFDYKFNFFYLNCTFQSSNELKAFHCWDARGTGGTSGAVLRLEGHSEKVHI